MATQEQIAEFIGRRIAIGRVQPGRLYPFAGYYSIEMPFYGPPLPSCDEVAAALARDSEFLTLQLGGLFNTPTGQFLEQAVEFVIPRTLSPEFELIVAALKLSADLQQRQARGNAVLAFGGSVLVGLLLNEIRKAA